MRRRRVSSTSLTKDGLLVNGSVAAIAPVARLTTRPLPLGPPATQSRPRPAFTPTDGVPGPWLITEPWPVRRSRR